MRMRGKRLGLCLLGVILLASLLVANPMWAQSIPTGILTGRVDDTTGAGLPGATVTVTSPALQGSRTTVTNVNGDYFVPNLPPGDYAVKVALSGFQTVTVTTKVSSGQQVAANARLAMAGVTSAVTVVAQSETVSQTAQAATTYSSDLMDKLPVTRTILGSVVMTPGVNQNGPNGAVTIAGAQSFDSVFTVNGVNIQDNIRGTPTNLFIEDAIQETTTMTSGVSAEYGHFTGGVINAVTKRGGNSFSGSVRATLNNDTNQANTPIKRTYANALVPTYEGTLGGPIWPDIFWFFGAGRFNNQQTTAGTNAIVPGGPTTTFPQANKNERYEGKGTISPFPNHTLTASYLWTTTISQNYYFTPLPVLDTNVLYNRQTPSDLLALNYNGVITNNLFVEAQYSKKKFTFINSGGTDTSLIGGTAAVSQAQGYGQYYSPIFCGVCTPETRNNNDYLAKGTYFLSSPSLGSHNIAFGYQNFGTQRMSNNYQSGSSWLLSSTTVNQVGANLYPVIDASSYLEYYPIPILSQGSDLRTQSVFVNDNWKFGNHLSFNIGVRWDKNHATDAAGHVTADDSQFSPRLAASYDIAGDGRFRVTASYARYVGQLQEGLAGSGATSAGTPASYYYYWAGAPINTNCPPNCTGTADVLRQMFAAIGVDKVGMFPTLVQPDSVTLPGVNLQIISPLKSPNANEYSIGFGGTLGKNFVYRVDAVRREFRDFYMRQTDLNTGFVSDDLGNEYNLGVYINSNLPVRNYTGLNTSFAYKTGPLSVGGNWTWSHTLGNFVGENSGSGPLAATFLNFPEYQQLSWTAPRGDLSQDQRHRVRIYANYDYVTGPVVIGAGLIQSFDTGTPYGASGAIDTRPFVHLGCTTPGIDQNHCYLIPPSSETYYFTARDAYRTDDIYRTDFALNVSTKVGVVEVYVQPQVLNVFNGQGVTLINNTTGISTSIFTGHGTAPDSRGLVRFNPFTTAPVECPAGSTAAQCIALGANWEKSTSFGQPTASTSFQIPRTWLITLGARF